MGRVIMPSKVPSLTKPLSGILASQLAVGSTVKLMEDGSAVEYLVVNQGIPSASSLYDSSCDGVWLIRKDIYTTRTISTNNYNASNGLNSYINNTFLDLFSDTEKAVIKQVSIPYVNGGGTGSVVSGADGLSTKIFLLSGYEVGLVYNSTTLSKTKQLPVDGAKLDYFETCNPTTTGDTSTTRIANYSGGSYSWLLRSPKLTSSNSLWYISSSGGYSTSSTDTAYGIRPALILPYNALFDKNTLLLKGVA